MNALESIATEQYLTFHLDQEVFAVDVLKVREVLDFTAVTKVPQTPDYMLGVINLRGNVVPVIDLRRRFGLPPQEPTRDSCIVVLEVALEGEPMVIGALADAVREVLDLDPGQIEPPPRIGSRLRSEFIQGMGKRDEEFIILLDIDKIFTAEELTLVQTHSEEPAVSA